MTHQLVGDFTKLCTQGSASLNDFTSLIDQQFAAAVGITADSEDSAVAQIVPHVGFCIEKVPSDVLDYSSDAQHDM